MKLGKYVIEFKIQGLPHTANHRYKHWSIKAKETRQWRTMVVYAVGVKKPIAPCKRAKITYVRHSSNECDHDNLASSFKAVQDGLVDAGVIENDKQSVIGTPEYRCERTAPGKGFITVRVEEL